MSERDFHDAVLTALGELKAEQAATRTEVKNIVARLDKLNGTVARHEEAIGKLQLEQARREGGDASSKSWSDRLRPVAWAGCGAFVLLVLLHSREVVRAFWH